LNAGDLELLRCQVAFTEKRNKNAIYFFCWNIYSIPAMIRQACFRVTAKTGDDMGDDAGGFPGEVAA
jgi:hypothetical protein